ncbi:SRPBCC family protein [Ornithinimicrobium murale]|uniref:SRPBCC family protein n=1 Tax=Ornithinimicrobium murale TaxID=1050153 RepID=UPI000E0DD8F1|nr:SRPBCC family protein [Ornithinimicrobium murale]
MNEITLSRVIEASPERVWQVLTDLERAAETLSGVTSVQLMTDGPYAVGTRWRETRTMFGRSATEEMWVAECDPLRHTEVRAESGGASYVTEFTLTPLGDGGRAELSVRFGAELTSPSAVTKVAMRLFGPLAARATRKALEQDLTDIASAAARET